MDDRIERLNAPVTPSNTAPNAPSHPPPPRKVYDSVYNGETHDARLVQEGWALPGFANASAWAAAAELAAADAPRGVMAATEFAGIALLGTDAPTRAWTRDGGATLCVDFGSNVAGVTVLGLALVSGAAGSNVTLRHGELLEHDGLPDVAAPDPTRVYYGNLRTAAATDVYILRGDEGTTAAANRTYAPRFTYHGYRYIELSGSADLSALAAAVLASPATAPLARQRVGSLAAPRADVAFGSGAAEAEELPVLGAIQAGAAGAQRSNLMSVPTDCPQRDERLGWMGDAGLSSDSMLLNYDVAPLLRGYLAQARRVVACFLFLCCFTPTDPVGSSRRVFSGGSRRVFGGGSRRALFRFLPLVTSLSRLPAQIPVGEDGAEGSEWAAGVKRCDWL